MQPILSDSNIIFIHYLCTNIKLTKQMVKAIFFDIDGTLVSFQTHTVPESTREALRLLREKGIKVFIATGRPKTLMMDTERSTLLHGKS